MGERIGRVLAAARASGAAPSAALDVARAFAGRLVRYAEECERTGLAASTAQACPRRLTGGPPPELPSQAGVS